MLKHIDKSLFYTKSETHFLLIKSNHIIFYLWMTNAYIKQWF